MNINRQFLLNSLTLDLTQNYVEDDFIAKGHQVKIFFQDTGINQISALIPENLKEEVKKIEHILQEELNPNLTNDQIAEHLCLYNRFETNDRKTKLVPLGFLACLSSKNLINKLGPISGNQMPAKAQQIADIAIDRIFHSFFNEYMSKKFGDFSERTESKNDVSPPNYPVVEDLDEEDEDLPEDIHIEDVPAKEREPLNKSEVHLKAAEELEDEVIIEQLPSDEKRLTKPIIEDLPTDPIRKIKITNEKIEPKIKKPPKKSTKEKKETQKRNTFWNSVMSFFQGIFQIISKLFSR